MYLTTTRKPIAGNTENTENKARCGNIHVITLQMKCGLNIRNEQCVNYIVRLTGHGQ
jgi:hypothetical protein